jgi:peptidoglycan/LPS O-acetylase OafA/YrhL
VRKCRARNVYPLHNEFARARSSRDGRWTRLSLNPVPAAVAPPAPSGLAERIPELDGLRGIAISLVLIFHCITAVAAERWPNPLAVVKHATQLGWTGVDLFFVLSGFLIGGILLSARESPNYFRVFYFRRVCRIFPAYFAYLLFMFLCYRYFLPAHSAVAVESFLPVMPWYSYVSFTQNIWMAARVTLGGTVIAITWSLAVEEQFYLTLPAIIRWISPRALPRLLVAGIITAPLLRLALLLDLKSRAQGAVYALLPCRMDSLLIGVLLALLLRRASFQEFISARSRWIWGLLAFLTLGMMYFNYLGEASPFPTASFGYTWIAIFYAAILVLALTQSASLLARFLRNRWLRGLGVIAYGTYLIHVIVFTIVMTLLRGHTNIHWSFGDLAAALFSIALTISIAQTSWLVFEKRFVRWGRKLDY